MASKIEPRGLRRADAARYLGISPSHFDTQRALGAIPAPKPLFGVMLYDRHDLDAIFDGKPVAAAANDNANPWDDAIAPPQTEARTRLH
ncbi:hypothetical protein J4G48_0026770 [Bradyrhizobium barranii subsp. apii]|uniref:hypothetical protein n=1 Tax=Bradyrhizobium barranii TaxID=2992140 RepID=UPI001AA0C1BB|nr:hypothetical protein [Bradyrhizobium barranii]UPT93020.1 hypothetical protein J4G48_0026770 [Bradyrhizobium barranii subsp. apii]